MATRWVHIKVPADVVELLDGDATHVYLRSRPEQRGCQVPKWHVVKAALLFYAYPLGREQK